MRTLTLLLVLLMLCPAASAASFKAKINSASARVYKNPATSTISVKGLKNLTVTVSAYKNGWARVHYKGNTGYIPVRDLNLASPIPAYTARSAAVYRSAGASYMGTLKPGVGVYVIGVDGKYCRVVNSSKSAMGYILTSCLTTRKPAAAKTTATKTTSSSLPSGLASSTKSITANASNAKRLEYAIYLAQSQLGKPYRSSANPPSSYNCSVLMNCCYSYAGFSVKGDAQQQGYDSRYKKVSYSDLKRGDMVCFNTNTSDSDLSDHTGIYLGGGYFIHASSGAGKVIVTNMVTDSYSYYKNAFSWGLRIG